MCQSVWFLILALLWLWESIVSRNDFRIPQRQFWRYWVIPAALMVVLAPAAIIPLVGFTHIFHVHGLESHIALAFVLLTAFYLAVLTLYYPRVNLATFRVTALVGALVGTSSAACYTIMSHRSVARVLFHLPLVSVSLYALVLSFTTRSIGGKINR